MNAAPQNPQKKTRAIPSWLWVSLIITVIICPIIFITFVLTTRLHDPADELSAVFFAVALSFIISLLLLCLWKNLRRALFAAACLATLAALFYAEEDWRGRHKWEQFQREAETRGEYFDLSKVVPPPVPDEQNFALTPVVASSYEGYVDRHGHAIWPYKANIANRLAMRYTADDTNMDLNLRGWTLGQCTDLARLQQYYRTLATKTNLFPIPPHPQSPAADVLLALSRFDPDLAEVRRAAQLPYSRFPLEYDKDNPYEIVLPHLGALKICTQMLSLRTCAELQTGQTNQAMDDLRLDLYLADSVQSEPFLITHLVRVNIVQLLLQPVWEGLAAHQWSDVQLAELDTRLARLQFLSDYQTSMHNEQAAMAKGMDYLRQHQDQYLLLGNGWGNSTTDPHSDFIMAFLAELRLIPSGWFYQNQLAYDRAVDKYYLPAVDTSAHTFAPALAKAGDAFLEDQRTHPSHYNIVSGIISTWMDRLNIPLAFAHGQASVDLARVAIALERYRLAHGKYPASLEALIPGYMASVPHDVIGGQPLHYRLNDDGQFVLYSVGWNETDDGGAVVMNHNTSLTQDFSQGDWVWRYPQR